MSYDLAPYISQKQAALLLAVTPTRIRQLDRSGQLKRYQVRPNVLGYLMHDVRALLIRRLRSEWETECEYLQKHSWGVTNSRGDRA